MIAVFFLFYLVLSNGLCQLTSNTIPEQISKGSPVVFGSENEVDVTIVCEIFINGNPTFTTWKLASGDSVSILRFFANGTGMDDVSQNFFSIGNPLGQSTTGANLTILTFTNSLNGIILECISGSTVLGNFSLRLLGELFSLLQNVYHDHVLIDACCCYVFKLWAV